MTQNDLTPLQVTAALITMSGRLLITQRPPHKKFGLLWEFPGGKQENGETLESCLRREIREELALEIQVGDLFKKVCHDHSDFKIHLYAYWCHIVSGNMQLYEHVAYRWAKFGDLHQYTFTAADRDLVAALQQLRFSPD